MQVFRPQMALRFKLGHKAHQKSEIWDTINVLYAHIILKLPFIRSLKKIESPKVRHSTT